MSLHPTFLGLTPESVQTVTDPLAWVVVAAFLVATVLSYRSTRHARYAAAGAWTLFAGFWLLLVPHFAFVQKSFVEGILSAFAVPASLYVAYLVATKRESLLVLTRAVAVMGLLYLPALALPWLQEWLIETTAGHVAWLLGVLGYHPELVVGDKGYLNTFVFWPTPDHRFLIHVVLACTGIGSMSVVTGLVLAMDAPVDRKAKALGIALPVIYVANVLRVAFIALASGHQWFQVFVDQILFLFGSTDAYKVSYFVSDRIIAQSLSVVVLVALIWVLLRVLPELVVVVEDVLYVATGDDYDLREQFGGRV
ncbi:archaeosortase A [Halospeciosus flavus]|uniref:Archaeosortase A n=1 Tax=Halospeciosus flavus TaxID=3032283 RepID=A0ABD5Z0N6_9EURY|nr:archaeosortase A [Halospeciosus flavus]